MTKFERGDVAVLKQNVRDSRENFSTTAGDQKAHAGLYRRLLRHVGRRCVVLDDATGDGVYYDVAFLSGFKVDALDGHHLDRPERKKRGR